ncbi:unnamed protein product [Ectocarpus sp. 6 AP-2014]
MEASEKPAVEDRGKETTAAVAEGTGIDDFDDFDSFLETVLSDCDEPGTAAVAQAAVKPSGSNPEKGHGQQDAKGQEGVNGDDPQGFAPGSGGIVNVPLTAADMESTCTTDTDSDDHHSSNSLHESDSFFPLPLPTASSSSASLAVGGQRSVSATSTATGWGGPANNRGNNSSSTQSPQLALLLPFVPRLVLQMFNTDAPQMPTGPMHMLLDAAVGLFDVSGFSKIADRLEKEEADGGSTSAVESEGVALRRKGSMMPSQSMSADRMNKTLSSRHSSVASSLGESGRDARPTRLRALFGMSMALGGRMGESRTNLKKGSAAERLTDYLNYILGLLTDTVEMHGGDILKFAGDAIIVCWSPTRELGIEPSERISTGKPGGDQLEIPCLRAVLCARDAMQTCTQKLLNSADPVMSSLGLHIGLGASKVLAGHVGGIENRWEFFITGEACEEMNRAEKDASNMEIVFSGAVGDWIRRYKAPNGCAAELATVRLESGNERLVFLECPPENLPRVLPHALLTNDIMCNVLKMYIPQPVKVNLKDGVVETAGGIRKITVVFMELLDLEIAVSDDKDTLDQVNRTVRKIQETVCHYDATLRQFIVDDKGTVAIVVFGLPPIFHEDNAARGINLGLRLLRQGVQAKIGVTTGSAFAGVIGAASRQEYAAVGDAVNMSARLMGKAPRNTVLCDASTAKEAEDAFSFKEAMRMKVKGKDEPIAVFEPLNAGAVLRTKSAKNNFLDRGDHADHLQEMMSNAHNPVGTKTVLIEGERGSGKSILLSKAVGMMDGHELHTFCSSGDMHERHTSLFPFRQILCQLLELDQDRLNWYAAANRPPPATGPSPAAAAAAVAAAASSTAAMAAAASAAAAGAAGIVEKGGEVASRRDSCLFRRASTRRRSSIVAVGLGLLGGGGGGGGATEGGAVDNANSGTDGGSGAPALAAPQAAPPSRKRRSSWVSNVPGRRRSIDAPNALNPYEPTAARGHLVKNPGFMALMKDPELGKHLPLLNMILPLYNEQAAGAVTTGAQDTHSKLRRLADMIAALLVHRLEASKMGAATTTAGYRKDAAVSATPTPASNMTRAGSAFRLAAVGDATKVNSVEEGRGCGAAIVLDNTQWLDHNSWELMHLLRKALPGILIFAAFRPFSEMNLKHTIALKTVPGTLKMNMGRLTATQVMLILSDSFGVQRTSEELLEFLEVTAKGNPRDVIHMMEDLFKEGFVEVNLGAVVILKELSENSLKIKDHTSAPVIAKYDQLTRGTQQLVQAAAVIGQEVPLDLLVDVHSMLTPSRENNHPAASSPTSSSASDDAMVAPGSPAEGGGGGGGGGERDDVDAQINTLVRVGLLERSSPESVRFVAKYMVTVIYDMILHSKRQDMHKAAGDQDLAVNFLVMAAEVAIACGDPTEAQLACGAVTQAVDDSGASGHLTLLDQAFPPPPDEIDPQVLRETKFHLLVGQTAILSQDWESAEMSLQLAVDMSGVDNIPKQSFADKIFSPWKNRRKEGHHRGGGGGKGTNPYRWIGYNNNNAGPTAKGKLRRTNTLTLYQRAEQAELSHRRVSDASTQSDESTSHREEVLDLNNVERYGPCGVMLKKCGNDAKMLLGRLNTYQEATRSFHRDLLTDNKKIIQAHNQMFVTSGGVLSVSHRTDPSVLPRYLRGNNHMMMGFKDARNSIRHQQQQQKAPPALQIAVSPRLSSSNLGLSR